MDAPDSSLKGEQQTAVGSPDRDIGLESLPWVGRKKVRALYHPNGFLPQPLLPNQGGRRGASPKKPMRDAEKVTHPLGFTRQANAMKPKVFLLKQKTARVLLNAYMYLIHIYTYKYVYLIMYTYIKYIYIHVHVYRNTSRAARFAQPEDSRPALRSPSEARGAAP